jgi:hypothetical protein
VPNVIAWPFYFLGPKFTGNQLIFNAPASSFSHLEPFWINEVRVLDTARAKTNCLFAASAAPVCAATGMPSWRAAEVNTSSRHRTR